MVSEKQKKTDFKLPKMGESITEGTILNWVVQEGERFDEGDILVEVGTDKVDNEVPAPFPGTLVAIKKQEKEVVKIGEVIAVLAEGQTAGSPASRIKNPEPRTQNPKSRIKNQEPKTQNLELRTRNLEPGIRNPEPGNTFISPLVDSIARGHHISYEELARIPATGKDGRLRKSDVFRYIEDGRPYQFTQPVSEPGYQIPNLSFDKGEGKIVEMDRMRRLIADHMVYSKHTSPHVTAYVEADMSQMTAWREKNKAAFQKKHGQKLTYTPLFVRAAARAIKDFPMINASVDGGNIIVKEQINIGMATALPNGNLIVPVIKDAGRKDLETLAHEINDLALRARENKLKPDETQGGTFTITNVGTFGSLMGTPIINQPEVAILATGLIKKRAEVVESPEGDRIEVRPMMYLSLSFDHRAVDGWLGGSFLKQVAEYFEQFNAPS